MNKEKIGNTIESIIKEIGRHTDKEGFEVNFDKIPEIGINYKFKEKSSYIDQNLDEYAVSYKNVVNSEDNNGSNCVIEECFDIENDDTYTSTLLKDVVFNISVWEYIIEQVKKRKIRKYVIASITSDNEIELKEKKY